ncbi:hypothetical protein [Mesorhizobium silamurunense]|uniref:hypothetical protein n=1 Tax=Mesorhizobium silamurunense TaxID=499528 RepID=UPI00177A7A9C|nr:hypothetical protein [Mesorhizobium silamurunense]
MSKQIENWKDTYEPEALAEKYGLTIEQAMIVINSNGPSKHGCEVGAVAFRHALQMMSKPKRGRGNLSA